MRRLFADIDFVATTPDQVMVAMTSQDQLEIFGNVLENAGKWARSSVWISLTTDSDAVIFNVEDDGDGVPADQRDRILGQGVRLDSKVTGSGLGLSIVEDIVDRYDGNISFASSPHGGLLVRIDLPTGCDVTLSTARKTASSAP
jgi:signal transduction histidine kinase